ncbi:disease resistance protein RPS2-like [Tasmannia lanceolata]|uniref:disease resistance protein RPS2-like n=1 Tax=Tasmannia lanceolata TaxID=3420 RepID=UPI004064B48B
MQVGAQVTGQVVALIPIIYNAIEKRVSYFKDLRHHVENLNIEMRELKSKSLDIEARIREAQRQSWRPKNEVGNWVIEVAKMEFEVNSINSKFDRMRSRFNLTSRYSLGKKAIKKTKIVVDLKGKGDFVEVAVCPSPARGLMMPITTTLGQETYEEMLRCCLHDEGTTMLCVHGMGGVGKTTLMKTLNNRLVGTHDFDVVIWVTVTKDHNYLEKIQIVIGSRLGMHFANDEDQESRSKKIFARLNNTRYVLMLDDLCQEISLNDVGIPKPTKENKCKILLGTRFLRVSNAMDADVQLKVKTLGSKEAWNLFHEKVGDVVLLQNIRPLAVKIVEEYGGLPLAIITVGRAMRGKTSKEVWLNARRALKESAVPEIEGMEPNVFRSLKLSYDYLEEDNIKHCFLYCALYPEDYLIYITELVEYWAMEGLVDNVDNLEDASNKGHHVLERLKDACLLEEVFVRGVARIKMHDLIRDLALWITSSSLNESAKFLVRAALGLKEAPKRNMWEGVERVSLMQNEIEGLSISPNCPTLVTLFLQSNHNLRTIPSSFFQFMPRLRVLDLSHTDIESFPTSLSSLVNLHALILGWCVKLKEIPPLEHLKQLQFLDLKRCNAIRELPQGIGELVNLKRLDLSHLYRVKKIPHGTICALSSLEELIMMGTPIKWASEVGVEDVSEGTSCNLGELANLNHIYSLSITINDLDSLAQDSFNRQQMSRLRKFHLVFGNRAIFKKIPLGNMYNNKILELYGYNNFTQTSKMIGEYVEALRIGQCNGLARGISEIVGDSMTLRKLEIVDCPQVNCVIDHGEVGHNIELLYLDSLPNLEKLIMGHGSLSLQKLALFIIRSCNQLSSVFSANLAQHLDKLEYLRIDDCSEIVEIIEEGDNISFLSNALPRLRHLHLHQLNRLRSICSPRLSFTALQQMSISKCPKLKKLPSCPGIRTFKAEKEWFEALDWEDGWNTKSLFTHAFVEWAEKKT